MNLAMKPRQDPELACLLGRELAPVDPDVLEAIERGPIDPTSAHAGKDYWDTVHHPVEDIGLGMQRLRIHFLDPPVFGEAPPAAAIGRLLRVPAIRARLIPRRAPLAMARHCATEYANLGAILPELFARYA